MMPVPERENPYKFGDAAIWDNALDSPLLQKRVKISFGPHSFSKQWKNTEGTLREMIESLCTFERGAKDGRCILPGAVHIPPGETTVARGSANMACNTLLLMDFDRGDTLYELATIIGAAKLFALLWNTHSNLKTITEIPLKKIESFLKEQGLSGVAVEDKHVLDYLGKSEKILSKLLTDPTTHVLGKVEIDGVVKYRVKHPPIEKVRALFVLKNDFNFFTRNAVGEKNGHHESVVEWKERYAGVSEKLGLPIPDISCADPARLMYTPRLPDTAQIGEGFNEIVVLNGDPLDLDAVERKSTKKSPPKMTGAGSVFVHQAQKAHGKDKLENDYVLTRPWLRKFLAVCSKSFLMAQWLQSEFPDNVRGTKSGNKIEFKCPNEDGHTDVNTKDRAFYAIDADGETGFMCGCLHDTCKRESGEDRLWYLDKLCDEYGINTVDELLPYLTQEGDVAWLRAQQEEAKKKQAQEDADVSAKAAAAQNAAAAAGNTGPIDAAIGALSSPPTSGELPRVLQSIARIDSKAQRETFAAAVKAKYPRGEGPTKDAIIDDIERIRQEVLAAATAAEFVMDEDMSVPSEDKRGEDTVVIWSQNNNIWTPPIMNDCVAKQIEAKNDKNPRLFLRAEGWVVRCVPHPNGTLVVGELDDDAWTHEIGRLVTFKKLTLTGGVQVLDPPAARVRDYRGRVDKNLPILERVVQVPVFTKNGTLITSRGYVPDLKVYLNPSFEALPVSAAPTQTEMDNAFNLLADILIDFPFSDEFGGGDQLPLRLLDDKGTAVLDEQGHPYANPARGKASFANMLSMILQPFVQHLIDGNSPAFHIDKAVPGTGANYLVDVVYLIAEGKRATVRVMSDNNEEFKKTITATLRQGASIIFVDNINRHVDSGALAAALTSGVWSDRVLGVSEMVDIPVKSVWVMAGNNLTFSPELMRRNVPIRMDAATPNPSQDRGQNSFKHFPLQDHVLSIRPQLVHAVHTFIANWFARGCPRGSVTMNSFDHWAAVLGGILEAAGVEGFLSNIPAYLATNNEEDSGPADYAQALFAQYGWTPFSIQQALAKTRDPFGAVMYGLDAGPLAKKEDDGVLISKLGAFIKKSMSKRTYPVTGHDGSCCLASLTRKKVTTGVSLQFCRVGGKMTV